MTIGSSAGRVVFVVGLGVMLAGCGYVNTVRAKKASKDANELYMKQDWKGAAEKYEEAITLNPENGDLYFYLGNSFDNMYRPTRRGEPNNDGYLEKAIANYRLGAERATTPIVKQRSLQYLVNAFGSEKARPETSPSPKGSPG